MGIYPILSVLPDKFARFLFEFHAVRFESLDLPPLPADRSDFNVHGVLEDDEVETKHCTILCVREEIKRIITLIAIMTVILGYYA